MAQSYAVDCAFGSRCSSSSGPRLSRRVRSIAGVNTCGSTSPNAPDNGALAPSAPSRQTVAGRPRNVRRATPHEVVGAVVGRGGRPVLLWSRGGGPEDPASSRSASPRWPASRAPRRSRSSLGRQRPLIARRLGVRARTGVRARPALVYACRANPARVDAFSRATRPTAAQSQRATFRPHRDDRPRIV